MTERKCPRLVCIACTLPTPTRCYADNDDNDNDYIDDLLTILGTTDQGMILDLEARGRSVP